MELPRRQKEDVYLPDGSLQSLIRFLKQQSHLHELRVAVVYAFDFRTRMLPYWYADKRMAPCSVRALADVLHASGFKHVRVVLQQWTPHFRPSRALLDGQGLDLLMVSAMQVHAESAYDLIRDAHQLGVDRPLILAGGPKAIYEPADFLELGPKPGVGADCVVTGEVYVLLDFLRAVNNFLEPGRGLRSAFEHARSTQALQRIPGLVFSPPAPSGGRVYAINTGVQRLVRDLDEMPMPDAGYRLLEPPHRRQTLSPEPVNPRRVRRLSPICSVISTHGCKFNCNYCPIPAVNQRTWRHKSAKRLAAEIAHVHETFGIREFFSTDDNFFNTRQTVVELMSALAAHRLRDGSPLGRRIRFYTEATEFDVHKNLDILPLCKRGGLSAIWFGIEDITAELVNKGQTQGKTAELFKRLRHLGIEPMAMMMHNDDQPLNTLRQDLGGLLNQARYLFDKGAVSYQCTYLAPAVGTRTIETMAKQKLLYRTVGGELIPQAFQDGNHVVASKHNTPWERQMNVLRGYWAFYNPLNTLRILRDWHRDPLSAKRLAFQIIGQLGIILTYPKLRRWARMLKRGPIERWPGLVPARIPMVDAQSGCETNWAIEHVPCPDLPQTELPSAPSCVTVPTPADPPRRDRTPLPLVVMQ